jgi:predicted nucleic acid-binding protein
MYSTICQQPDKSIPTPRSDSLRPLYELCKTYPALSKLFDMQLQIRLVLDTNVVIDELLFVTSKRRNESARTALREAMDSGVILMIAPTKMHEEVDKHIPRLARERSLPEAKFREAWQDLRTRIEFREVKINPLQRENVRDQDDIEFVTLYKKSGADAVLTRDLDIPAMGAKSVGPEVLPSVRDYARAKSPEVSLRIGNALIIGVPIAALAALAKLLLVVWRTIRSLSPELQFLLLTGAILAALHPRSRKALRDGFSSLGSGLKTSTGVFAQVVGELSLEVQAAQLEVKAKQTVVENLIPTSQPSAVETNATRTRRKKPLRTRKATSRSSQKFFNIRTSAETTRF